MNILPTEKNTLRVVRINARQPRAVYMEMRHWLNQNGSAWPTRANISTKYFLDSITFMYEEDATAFKLKFKI